MIDKPGEDIWTVRLLLDALWRADRISISDETLRRILALIDYKQETDAMTAFRLRNITAPYSPLVPKHPLFERLGTEEKEDIRVVLALVNRMPPGVSPKLTTGNPNKDTMVKPGGIPADPPSSEPSV